MSISQKKYDLLDFSMDANVNKLECFSAMAMQGLLSGLSTKGERVYTQEIARISVEMGRHLLEHLDRERKITIKILEREQKNGRK